MGIQVQQELMPRVSVNVGYYKRIFGNFLATDNLATQASDYNAYSIVVPNDPRLPSAGNTITGLYDVTPALSGITNKYVRVADTFGKQTNHWRGGEGNFSR